VERLVPIYIYCDWTEVLARIFVRDADGVRVGQAAAEDRVLVCPEP